LRDEQMEGTGKQSGRRGGRLAEILMKEIWGSETGSLSTLRGMLVRIVRVGHLVVRGFRDDDLPVHASALTFATLMSLVPLLAIAFAVLKGLGVAQEQIDRLMEWKESMPLQFQGFIDQILEIVHSTSFAALGWVGLVALLVTAIMVLGSMEASFNRIWAVRSPRNIFRRIANYISILVVVPILIGVGSTVSASLHSEAFIARLGSVGVVYQALLRLTPLVGAWLAFGFLYTFMPNTRVRFVPAVVSSLAGALLWTLWQKTYISLQIGVARYNAIYGTFASVPIFLAWLYVGWVIVLLGAEVAFAVQNHATYHLEQRAESASFRARLLIAVAVVVEAVEAMREGSEAFEAAEFARRGKIPVRLVNEVVGVLSRAGWIVEVADQPGSYVLRRDPDSLDLRDIVELILDDGASPEQLGLLRAEGGLARVAEAIDRGIEEGVPGLTMGELVRDVQGGEGNAGGGGSDV